MLTRRFLQFLFFFCGGGVAEYSFSVYNVSLFKTLKSLDEKKINFFFVKYY